MQNLTKNKQFAEDEARQLRCCGVSSARVQKVIAYEVITERVLSKGPLPDGDPELIGDDP